MPNHPSITVRCLCALALFGFLSGTAVAQNEVEVPARVLEAVNSANRVALKGNVHPLVRPQYDRGIVPDSMPVERMQLVLKRSNDQEAALESFLASQQDKSSPNFHKWLTPEQFGKRFGPADGDIHAVTDWLTSQGFRVDKVSPGRAVIEFSGNAEEVRNAFGTEIHKYLVNGEEHWANVSDPQIPAALAPVIIGINSLHNFSLKPMHHVVGVFSKSRSTGEVRPITPLFTFQGCGATCNAVGPYDFATIYNLLPLWKTGIDGTGQVIAIAGDSNINVQDVRDFRTLFGLPSNDPRVIVNGSDPGITGDESEADLDVQWAGAVAKNAAIELVVSAPAATNGVDLSAQYIVDNNFAPVMSVSFGLCELFLGTAGNQHLNQLWQQAAAQGITVLVAVGDQGAAGCDVDAPAAVNGLAVSGVASTPYNVAVGGTDFNDASDASAFWNSTNNSNTQASAKGYIPETTWNNSCTNALLGSFGFSTNAETNCNNPQVQQDGLLTVTGGGGGVSNCTAPTDVTPASCAGGYSKPSWQAVGGVPNDGKRDLPDISLFAGDGLAANFYVVCEQDADPGNQSCNLNSPFTDFLGVGGTSAASPSFAGIIALVNQETKSRQGNANPILYALAAKPGSNCPSSATPSGSCIFYDITSGTIAMPCLNGSPNCTTSNTADTYGVLSGYNARAGYDLATGLGSVNAANLVNSWTTAPPSLGTGGGFSLLTSALIISIPTGGQSGSAMVTVNGLGGFSGLVSLSCSVSPSTNGAPGCSLSPSSIILNSETASGGATLTIATTATLSDSIRQRRSNESVVFAETILVSLAFILLLTPAKTARWATLLVFGLFGGIVGCGSPSGGAKNVTLGTPPGNYVVAITATSGTIDKETNIFVTIP